MRIRLVARLAAAAMTTALVIPAPAVARDESGSSPIRPVVRPNDGGTPTTSDRLIVAYERGTRAAARAQLRSRERLESVAVLRDGTMEAVRAPGRSLAAAAAALRTDPRVASVTVDHRRAVHADPTKEKGWPFQWGHHNTGQRIDLTGGGSQLGVSDTDVDGLEALRVTAGTGVVVAVIDDGVDLSHPDLAGRAWTNPGESGSGREKNRIDDDGNGYVDDVNGWDFCHDDNTVHDFEDDWHGTAVAGTLAASLNGVGIVGMAPNAKVMALKFLGNDAACGFDSQAIAAIDYAASFGVRIINASWGGPDSSPPLESAIERSGALFVAAAGNAGRDIDARPDYPAAFDSPNILSVGAIDNRARLASFSNYGDATVDVVAPGVSVVGPVPADSQYPIGWAWVDGTSFSAPYVTGVAALLGSVRPALLPQPTALRSRVINTGVPIAAAAGRTASGRLVNARRAIDYRPPVLAGQPSAIPVPGSTLGASSVRIQLAWPGATDDVGVAGYRVEMRRNGGAWTKLGDVGATRTLETVVGLSGSYDFRVSGRDASYNVGAPSEVLTIRPRRYEETAGLSYTGTWRAASSTSASGGATRFATQAASVTLRFTGRAVAVVAPRSATRSGFRVTLDGSVKKTVSLYAPTTRSRVIVDAYRWSTSAAHVLRLDRVTTSGRSRADVDAFIVLH